MTAYQTDAQIKTSYEANADTNAFTDAFQTKLNGIEAGATAGRTAAEIRTLVGSASDSNVFTDAEKTKLSGIETGATADQTGAEIKTAYEGEADTNAFTDAEQTKLSGIEAGATVNAATGGTSGGLGTQADPQYGSVQFRGGTTLLGDSVFVYDTTNNKLGVGIQQPKNELHILKELMVVTYHLELLTKVLLMLVHRHLCIWELVQAILSIHSTSEHLEMVEQLILDTQIPTLQTTIQI